VNFVIFYEITGFLMGAFLPIISINRYRFLHKFLKERHSFTLVFLGEVTLNPTRASRQLVTLQLIANAAANNI